MSRQKNDEKSRQITNWTHCVKERNYYSDETVCVTLKDKSCSIVTKQDVMKILAMRTTSYTTSLLLLYLLVVDCIMLSRFRKAELYLSHFHIPFIQHNQATYSNFSANSPNIFSKQAAHRVSGAQRRNYISRSTRIRKQIDTTLGCS